MISILPFPSLKASGRANRRLRFVSTIVQADAFFATSNSGHCKVLQRAVRFLQGRVILSKIFRGVPGKTVRSHRCFHQWSRGSDWAKDTDALQCRIQYEVQSVHIAPSSMFTAFPEAIVIAAQHEGDEPGASIVACDTSRRAAIVARRDPAESNLTWNDLEQASGVLWRKVVVAYDTDSPIREGVLFSIYARCKRIGEGCVVGYSSLIPPPAVAVAR